MLLFPDAVGNIHQDGGRFQSLSDLVGKILGTGQGISLM